MSMISMAAFDRSDMVRLTLAEPSTVATLFEYVRTAMPPQSPGSLSDQQYADAIAQMFALSKMPAGETELPADAEALAGIVIGPQPD